MKANTKRLLVYYVIFLFLCLGLLIVTVSFAPSYADVWKTSQAGRRLILNLGLASIMSLLLASRAANTRVGRFSLLGLTVIFIGSDFWDWLYGDGPSILIPFHAYLAYFLIKRVLPELR